MHEGFNLGSIRHRHYLFYLFLTESFDFRTPFIFIYQFNCFSFLLFLSQTPVMPNFTCFFCRFPPYLFCMIMDNLIKKKKRTAGYASFFIDRIYKFYFTSSKSTSVMSFSSFLGASAPGWAPACAPAAF